MMTMCPRCFELYMQFWTKPRCACNEEPIRISPELIYLVQLLLERELKVTSALCRTVNDEDSGGKITQINIEFGEHYPRELFPELPPEWSVYAFDLVKDHEVIKSNLTGLSCECVHPPGECDEDNVFFDTMLTISNMETWLKDRLDPEACKAVLTFLRP
ncbi:MAG TPA: hypothetical protein GXX34_06810 [Clostridia bacterium]|nr:hypothetical protein [Clostridia bacterium]